MEHEIERDYTPPKTYIGEMFVGFVVVMIIAIICGALTPVGI